MKNIILVLVLIITGLAAVSSDSARAETTIGAAFTLTNQDGKQVSDSDFHGKYMLLFFGFTHCPDLCPTTLLIMSQTIEQLKDDASNVAPIFITVDPVRDTPAVMKKFLGTFNPAIVGLTGDPKEIDKLETGYKTYSTKIEDKDAPGGYGFDHSGYIYLMDKQGKFLTVFTSDSSPQTIAAKIREYSK